MFQVMFGDFLNFLLLKKADESAVADILKKEKFAWTQENVALLLKGNQKGVRYGNAVLPRKENGEDQRRFFKISIDGTVRTFNLFRRQVKVSEALCADKSFPFPKLAVIKSHVKPPIPYAIFETRDSGDDFGFMHDEKRYYERFSKQDIEHLVSTICSFHIAGFNIDKNVWQYTQPITQNFSFYEKELQKMLAKIVSHKQTDGTLIERPIEELIAQYTGIENISERILALLKEQWEIIEALREKENQYLVHADMSIDNVYKHKDGKFELLDFEWCGKTDNLAIAIMYDYGNLRARAWSSPEFQSLLDNAMLEIGKNYYKNENALRAGMRLGKLRSSLLMSRFHLDFNNTVKKDRRTEEEYREMYPRSIASLVNALNG